MLTQERYCMNPECPICGTDEYYMDVEPDFRKTTLYARCWCSHCSAEWRETYNIIDFQMVQRVQGASSKAIDPKSVASPMTEPNGQLSLL